MSSTDSPSAQTEDVQSLSMSEARIRIEHLEHLRKRAGMNKTDWCQTIGKRPQQYSAWLSGDRNLGEHAARHIEHRLGMNPGDLSRLPEIGADVEMPKAPEPRESGKPLITNVSESVYPIKATKTKRVPIKGSIKMQDDCLLDASRSLDAEGFVLAHTDDPHAYALRISGDGARPALKSGWFVLLSPNSQPSPGEYAVINVRDGRVLLVEVVYMRTHDIVVENPNGGQRQTIEMADVESVLHVVNIIPPSQLVPE
jgi:hypothetical protein